MMASSRVLTAVEKLDDTVSAFIAYVLNLPETARRPSRKEEWGAWEIMAHIVYWHEQYATILADLLAGRVPSYPQGTFRENNAKATKEKAPYSIEDLAHRLREVQGHLVLLSQQERVQSLALSFKEGGKAWPFEAAINRVEQHIRTHLLGLRKASKAELGSDQVH